MRSKATCPISDKHIKECDTLAAELELSWFEWIHFLNPFVVCDIHVAFTTQFSLGVGVAHTSLSSSLRVCVMVSLFIPSRASSIQEQRGSTG